MHYIISIKCDVRSKATVVGYYTDYVAIAFLGISVIIKIRRNFLLFLKLIDNRLLASLWKKF
jgi:hypothetical protein